MKALERHERADAGLEDNGAPKGVFEFPKTNSLWLNSHEKFFEGVQSSRSLAQLNEKEFEKSSEETTIQSQEKACGETLERSVLLIRPSTFDIHLDQKRLEDFDPCLDRARPQNRS